MRPHLYLGIVLVLLSACSRSTPDSWSSESPASAEAEQLAPAHVTLALDGDPPLPGEPAEGWIGLESAEPAVDPHAHHKGHKMPAKEQPAPEKPAADAGHGGHSGH